MEIEEVSATPPPAASTRGGRSSTSWALLFARLVLGLIFFMAGWHKVFVLTPAGHVEKWFLPFGDTFLPIWSLWAAGLAIPFVELIAGALLLLGWRVREALIALGVVLVVVTFGHLLKEPLYPFHEHVIPRLALLLFLLVMPRDEDRYSVEGILRSRTTSRGSALSQS
jgi:thiosulfate dehydrogenase (quinone) large subunit